MGRVVRFLASAKLAAWLIGVLIGFLIISFIVPQQGVFPAEEIARFLSILPSPLAAIVELLGFEKIFTSWLFLATSSLLALNLVVCTIRRVTTRVRGRIRISARSVPQGAFSIQSVDPESAHSLLTSLGAAVFREDCETWYSVRRGDLGFLGSCVLHLALITLAIGGVVTGLTTFTGEMVLTEGQTRSDAPESYLSITETPRFGSAFGDFALTLERMKFTYEGDTVVDAVARMTAVETEGSRTEEVRVNYPLLVQGKSFLLLEAGHSVWITVTDSDGGIIVDSFVNLASLSDAGFIDSLQLGDSVLTVLSRPDGTVPLDEPVSRGLGLASPIVGVTLEVPENLEDYGWLAPGGSTTLGDWTVAVREVRLWNRFLVRADGGRYIVYAAFLLVIIGAVMRFLDPDRYVNVHVRCTDGTCDARVWGRARYDLGIRESLVDSVSRRLADESMASTSGDMEARVDHDL